MNDAYDEMYNEINYDDHFMHIHMDNMEADASQKVTKILLLAKESNVFPYLEYLVFDHELMHCVSGLKPLANVLNVYLPKIIVSCQIN